MNKVRSDTILDMNLEKSRVKELVSMRLIKKKNKNQYIHLHRKTLKNTLVPNLFFLATAKQKSHKSICNNILFSIEPQLTYSVGNTSLFSWTQGWYNGRNSWKHTRFFNSSWSVFFWGFFLAICCHLIFFVLPVTLNRVILLFSESREWKEASGNTDWNHGNGLYTCCEYSVQRLNSLRLKPVHFVSQTAEQDRHLTQTNMKIDTEIAGLKTMLESHKLDTIKYLAGNLSRY